MLIKKRNKWWSETKRIYCSLSNWVSLVFGRLLYQIILAQGRILNSLKQKIKSLTRNSLEKSNPSLMCKLFLFILFSSYQLLFHWTFCEKKVLKQLNLLKKSYYFICYHTYCWIQYFLSSRFSVWQTLRRRTIPPRIL